MLSYKIRISAVREILPPHFFEKVKKTDTNVKKNVENTLGL